MGANEAVDTTQAEGSTDRMTYEQFLYELNIADSDEARKYYDRYNSYIDDKSLPCTADEAFESIAQEVESFGNFGETESTEVANNDSTPANTNSNTSSNTSSSSTSASTDSTNTSSDEGNASAEDDGSDAYLTGDEARQRMEEINGGHPTGNSTLSEEELQEAKDQWAETVKAY